MAIPLTPPSALGSDVETWVLVSLGGEIAVYSSDGSPIGHLIGIRGLANAADFLRRFGASILRAIKRATGGALFNASRGLVLFSENDPSGVGQRQYGLLPGGKVTPPEHDVDAIYFRDGGVLKVSNGTLVVVLRRSAMDHWSGNQDSGMVVLAAIRSIRYFPSITAAEREFGPIVPGIPGI